MANWQSAVEGLGVIFLFTNIYQNKKVLITGHTGFKGSWLAMWLNMLGANVVGIALEPNTQPAHFAILDLDIKSHLCDINDHEKISKVIARTNPDIIFHLAAQPLVRDSYENPLNTFSTNVLGTANVLNACRDLENLKAVVVITSDKCYENREWLWGYRENDPMGGYDPYSASKGCAELVTSSFRNSYFNLDQFGKKHQVLIASARAGNVVGGGDWAKDRLIPDLMRAVVAGEKVLIRNPNATRPWQHVLECLSGYLCLGEKLLRGEKCFAEAWNFAPSGDGQTPVRKIVEMIQTIWPKLNCEFNTPQHQPHEAHLLKLDSSKANNVLQWKEVWDLSKTIEVTANWYLDYYKNKQITTVQNIQKYCDDASRKEVVWAKK